LFALRHRKAGLLSGGEQQILTLARALASQPRLLLADELCLGLAPKMSDRMLGFVRQAAHSGVAVLLVEQQAARALAIADRAYVLNRGRVQLEGPASDVLAQLDRVSETYFGVQSPSGRPATQTPT
jgi:branched-chain amino acid transport system ATP-binding protein